MSGEIDDKYILKYKVNADEDKFFEAVYKEIGEGICVVRMSDGTLDVSYHSYPIGKVKLQGRKHSMQILKGLNSIKSITGSVEDFIPYIVEWKKYANRILK